MSQSNNIDEKNENDLEKRSLDENLDMDQCLEYVNPKGKYQYILFLILLGQGIIGSFIFVGGPYFFEDPIFICQDGSKCKQVDACKQKNFQILESSNNTFTKQFELYCDRQYLKNLSLSFIFIGSLFGTFFFSFLSDLKGRRLPMIISWAFSLMGIGILAFSQNVAMIFIGQFFGGFGIYPASTLAFIILSEQSIGKFRKVTTGFLLLGFTISEGILNLLGYLFNNNWQILIRYWFFIPMILLQSTMFYIIESPRFYLNKDKHKVVSCLNKIAVRNAKNSYYSQQKLTKEQIDFNKYSLVKKKGTYSYFTLFKYKSTKWVTIACSIQKFLMIFVNYGAQFSVSDFGFSIYINATIGFSAELLSYAFLVKVLNQFKRKPSALFFQILSSLFCLLFIAFPIPDSCVDSNCYQKFMQIILYFLSRISITAYFVIISAYFPELYPTSVRSLGLGFIRATGISGSILSSFAISWSKDLGISPLVSFGIIGSLGIIFGFYLPETQNLPLKDEISEIKYYKDSILDIDEKQNVSKESHIFNNYKNGDDQDD
ncbi:MFS transporter (macronuclear) [Tetrahymena thermophila SB210]|uniref:MFS transporter n=1 Tax=Tetrahymena thermophila (strain SB210) TaxID=312017 RepID=W7XBU8_TETTS|nr:MFS transporter [Tetrahymena thermophila SB210]EWS71161.1 MFS transporter [Tetrahymena thermophila SB210]|eukprot:XP_012656302.1 MFS transporter [Tetrahymena thermophila SB210]